MNLMDPAGYISQELFLDLHSSIQDRPDQADLHVKWVADLIRFNTLLSVARAGTGHLGASLSMADLMAEVYFRRGHFDSTQGDRPDRDVLLLSKGHAAPGHYAALAARGYFPNQRLDCLRRWGGLPGHSHVSTPGVDGNTGSLAMGLSRAVGFAIARQRFNIGGNVYVVTGDGELQEGQAWEALLSAASFACPQLYLIIDANSVQTDQLVRDVLIYRDMPGTLSALGFAVAQCDGHDPAALRCAFAKLAAVTDRPHCLIARTIKGSGVSFMEHPTVLRDPDARYIWHNKPPNREQLAQALGEILGRVKGLRSRGVEVPDSVPQESVPRTPAAAGIKGKPLVPGFADGVRELARLDPRVVVLDGDLEEDCGLTPFRKEFPERFLELGIMEQHMCSSATALSSMGYVPVIVSYSAFLSSRSNEQIYNLATYPSSRFLLAGHLAGVIPATPGMSHQAFRDIGVLRSIPGLRIVQPLGPEDCKGFVLRYGRGDLGQRVYLRIVMAPSAVELPAGDSDLPIGQSQVLRRGSDAILIASGPVMAGEAVAAAEMLADEKIGVEVWHHPWSIEFANELLAALAEREVPVIVCEDHHVRGGLGEGLLAALGKQGLVLPAFGHVALDRLPDTGFREEALRGMGLDRDTIALQVRSLIAPMRALTFDARRKAV